MQRLHYFFICLVCIGGLAYDAQAQVYKYRLELTDKNNSPYSIFKPSEYLSARAIARRRRMHIPINEQDLPVNPNYIQAVQRQGAIVHNTSKWLNSITIEADSILLPKLRALPFVQKITLVGFERKTTNSKGAANKIPRSPYQPATNPYGAAYHQLAMLGADKLHQQNYKGQGKLIAVLDGGFMNVDAMPFFDSLFLNNRMWQGYDFVERDAYVYEGGSHGTNVLSTMAANIPGVMIGTAPDASYVCIKTEDGASETKAEEDNWVAGAEFADSLGADIISSSLGYNEFDIPSQNYTYQDLNGVTGFASKGAGIAVTKGLVVVNSAGNSGAKPWKYIGVPADGIDVLAVAAVDSMQYKGGFSSFGPASDGRVKPDVAAMGVKSVLADMAKTTTRKGNGTSYACPILAGFVASLWSSSPQTTNYQVIHSIRQAGSIATQPDDKLGYGIPYAPKAYLLLQQNQVNPLQSHQLFAQQAYIQIPLYNTTNIILTSTVQPTQAFACTPSTLAPNYCPLPKNLPSGTYILKLTDELGYLHPYFLAIGQ